MPASRDINDGATQAPRRMSFGSSASAHSARPHSSSLSALNANNRVNRRKSSSSGGGVNLAALAEVTKDIPAVPSVSSKQRNRPVSQGDLLGRPAGSKTGAPHGTSASRNGDSSKTNSAVIDGPPLSSLHGSDKLGGKARARRASEGTRLIRPERRRSAAGELKCDKCGKTYKHGSCLTKHLWEHTPEWNLTSKLLISKHQQVQLLEAASVLMVMGNDKIPADLNNESAIQMDSDLSSDSPAASGLSDPHGDEISSRTSTPSQEDHSLNRGKISNRPLRQDSYGSSVFTHSHHSSAYSLASSAPNDSTDLSYYRQWGSQRRPSTAGMSTASSYVDNDEQADVAAAAESLISCSLGTPSHGPTVLPPDVPPVPPLPAKFLKQSPSHIQAPEVEMVEAYPGRPAIRSREGEEDLNFFGRMDQ